jgi:hypothetical protein
MAETAWAIPEGFEEVKVAPWQGPVQPGQQAGDIPEGFEVVDITKDDPETTALRVAAMTARANAPRSKEWWAERRNEAAYAEADPVSRLPAPISETYRAVAGAATSIGSTVARPFSKDAADYLAATGEQIATDSEALREDDWMPWVSRMYGGAAQSIVQSTVAAPLGPLGIIGSFALTEGNQALYDAEQAGLTGNDRLKYAATQGVIEGAIAGVFQKFAPGSEKFIADAVRGAMRTTGKQFVKATAQELPEELLTETAHAAAEAVSGVDPRAAESPEFWQRLGETVVQTIATLGLAHGASQIANRGRRPTEAVPETAPDAPVGNSVEDAERQVERLRGIRAKGFVTWDEAKALGLSEEEAKNRASRMAALSLQQREAERELERARAREVPVEANEDGPVEEPGKQTYTGTEEALPPKPAPQQGRRDVPTDTAPAAPEEPTAPPSSRDDAKQEAVGLAELMAKKRAEATPASAPPAQPAPPAPPAPADGPLKTWLDTQPRGMDEVVRGNADTMTKSGKYTQFVPDNWDSDPAALAKRDAYIDAIQQQGFDVTNIRHDKKAGMLVGKVVPRAQPVSPPPAPTTPRKPPEATTSRTGRAVIDSRTKPAPAAEDPSTAPSEAAPQPAQEAAEALRGVDLGVPSAERSGIRTVEDIARKHKLNPTDLWRSLYPDADPARVSELMKGARISGNRDVDARREAKARKQAVEEAELFRQYPPGTKMKVGSYPETITMRKDGTLDADGRTMGKDALWNSWRHNHKITVLSKPEAVEQAPAAPADETVPLPPRLKAIQGKQPLRRDPTLSDELPDAVKVQDLRKKKMQGRTQKAATEAVPAKEPWQMTREEYAQTLRQSEPTADEIKAENKKLQGEVSLKNLTPHQADDKIKAFKSRHLGDDSIADFYHRKYVEQAAKRGKPVPSEVLKDYPELASRAPTQPQNASAAETGPTVVPTKETLPEAVQEPKKQAVEHGPLPMFSVYPTQFRGVKKYAVKEFDKGGFGDAMFGTEAEAQAHADIKRQNNASEVARADKAKAEAEAAQKQQKEHEDSFQGFLSADPKTKGRQLKTLGANLKYKGKVVTRKSLVESKVADGWVVTAEGRLQGPDESFLDARDLTETGIKYARHLASSKSPSVTDSNTISETPPESGSGKDSEAAREPWQMTAYEYAVQPARRIAELQKSKPRPIGKLFGTRGPSPEQAAAHAAEVKDWNRQHRQASKAHKEHLADQGAHARLVKQAVAEGKPVPEEVLADYPELAAEPASKPKSLRKPKKPKEPQTTETNSVVDKLIEWKNGERLTDMPDKFGSSWAGYDDAQRKAIVRELVDRGELPIGFERKKLFGLREFFDDLTTRYSYKRYKTPESPTLLAMDAMKGVEWFDRASSGGGTVSVLSKGPSGLTEEMIAEADSRMAAAGFRPTKTQVDHLRGTRHYESKTKLQQAASEALDDAHSEADKLLKKVRGKGLPSNPMLDPEIVVGAGKVVYKYAKANLLQFAAFTEQLASDIGQSFVDDLLPVLKSEWNKLHATGEFKGMEPADPPKAASGDTTGTKNAKTDELRAKTGMEERPPVEPESVEEWQAKAAKRMADDPEYAGKLAAELAANPRALNPVEEAVLGRHLRDLENRRQSGEDVRDEQRTAVEADERVGTIWGRAGVARQVELAADFSVAGLIRQHMRSVNETPTDEQMDKYEELADKLAKREGELSELQAKLAQAEVDKQIAEAKAASTKAPAPAKRGTKRQVLQQKASAATAKFKEKWASLNMLGIVSDPEQNAEKWDEIVSAAVDVVKVYTEIGIDSFLEVLSLIKKDFGKITANQKKAFKAAWDKREKPESTKQDHPEIGELARKLTRFAVESGITEREAVVDAVHEELTGMGFEVSRSDTMAAMSGYGDFRELSKDEVSVKIRAIKGELQQLLKLEDMQSGRAPAKTGVERREPTDEERRLIKQVNEQKKKGGYTVTDPARQLKSALGAAKTAARNRIADLEKAIASREKIVSGQTKLTPDAELTALQKQRDQLNEEYRTIFPQKRSGFSEASRLKAAEKMLDRLIAETQADLNSRQFDPKEKRKPLTSPEVDAKRQQLKSLRESLKAAKQAAADAAAAEWESEGGATAVPKGKKPLTEAQRLKSKQAAIERQIEDLQADLRAGRLDPQAKAPPLSSPETEAKQIQLDQLKEARKQARAASPEYQAKEAAKQNAQYKRSLERLLGVWETRRDEAARGILPKKRKPTPLDKEILEKKYQIDLVKRDAQALIDEAARAQRSLTGKALGFGGDLLDLARSVWLGLEASPVLLQGAAFTYGFPVKASLAIMDASRAAVSRRADFAIHDNLLKRTNHADYVLGEMESTASEGPLSQREELIRSRIASWLASQEGAAWALPRWAAEGVIGLERAVRTFMNTMRADLFDYQKASIEASRPGTWSADDAKVIGNSSNVFSGRGKLPMGMTGAGAGRVVFLAPRWVWSRAQLLTFQPLWKGDKATRLAVGKVYVRAALGYAAAEVIRHAIYSLLADDDDDKPKYETDMRSSDFGKRRIGETRMGSNAGLSSLMVLAARVATGERKLSNGEIVPIRGDDVPYGADDTFDIFANFVRSKLAPLPSGVIDWIVGKDIVGNKTTAGSVIAERVSPMTWGDIFDAERELGVKQGTVAAIDAFIGNGLSTYGDRTRYRDTDEAGRKEMVERDLENMTWADPEEPAYAEFLTEDQLQAFRDRRSERRSDVLIAATYDGDNEKTLKTRDKNIGFLQEMKAEGVSLAEAEQLLKAHYHEPTDKEVAKAKRENREPRNSPMTAGERPGYNAKLRKLRTLYGE